MHRADDEENDRPYETHLSSSVRRYRATTADVPVTQKALALVVHDQRRASRRRESAPSSPIHPHVPSSPVARTRLFASHPVLFFGMDMVGMMLM
jgi:hypothetical protein